MSNEETLNHLNSLYLNFHVLDIAISPPVPQEKGGPLLSLATGSSWLL